MDSALVMDPASDPELAPGSLLDSATAKESVPASDSPSAPGSVSGFLSALYSAASQPDSLRPFL